MPAAVDPVKAEQTARTNWASLDAPPPPAVDDDGRKVAVTPSARLQDINHRARVIAVSDSLARAVAGLLAGLGVTVAVHQVRVEPAVDDLQVVGIRTEGGLVVPIRPATTVLRVWRDGGEIVLDGEPVAVVELVAEPDGWVPAARIAEALAPHLR